MMTDCVPNIAQYDPFLLFNTSTLTESLYKPPEFMLQEPTERPPILQTLGFQHFNVEWEGLADIESCEDWERTVAIQDPSPPAQTQDKQ